MGKRPSSGGAKPKPGKAAKSSSASESTDAGTGEASVPFKLFQEWLPLVCTLFKVFFGKL